MPVPNIFGTATSAIPLSQLDTNFATPVTIGNTAVQLGNTVTSFGNVTLTNVTISSGNVTIAGANVSGTANVSTLVVTGNQTFVGTGNRITGDFSNATAVNRVAFQTSTVNGNTGLYAIPNGTATTANYIVSANSDPTNTSIGVFGVVGGSDARLTSGITGTGTYLPMTFYTGGSERMRILTDGSISMTTSGSANTTHLFRFNENGGEIVLNNNAGANGTIIDFSSGSTRLLHVLSTGDEQIGLGAGNTTGSLQFMRAGFVEAMRIDSSGGLILVGSTAQKATGTTWSNPSDQRLKDNIRDYGKGTTELMQVRVREWEYNGKGGTTEGMKGLGVIADEVMTVLPNTVENYDAKLNVDDEETTAIKKFDATEITWLLVKTVQEQQALIVQLQADVAALKGTA